MEKDYKGKFIGEKKITSAEKTEEKTAGGFSIIKVSYGDESIEHLSELMFARVVSDKRCDASELREKRVEPIVGQIGALVRDWGLKVGELPYMGQMINQSLNFNYDEALYSILADWMPRPKSLDDVTYTDVDRILRSKNIDVTKPDK